MIKCLLADCIKWDFMLRFPDGSQPAKMKSRIKKSMQFSKILTEFNSGSRKGFSGLFCHIMFGFERFGFDNFVLCHRCMTGNLPLEDSDNYSSV